MKFSEYQNPDPRNKMIDFKIEFSSSTKPLKLDLVGRNQASKFGDKEFVYRDESKILAKLSNLDYQNSEAWNRMIFQFDTPRI